MTTQNTDRFTVEAGDSVRVKNGTGDQWDGERGIAVKVVSPAPRDGGVKLWEVHFAGEIRADFSERELTVMEKGVAK